MWICFSISQKLEALDCFKVESQKEKSLKLFEQIVLRVSVQLFEGYAKMNASISN